MSLSYRPDFPPVDPSILTTCQYVIPDKSMQYRTSYSAAFTTNWAAISVGGVCNGARMVRLDDGSPRLFLGMQTKLCEQYGNTQYDVTRTVGGNYTNTAGVRFWFEQFGPYTVASNKADATQVRSGAVGTAFTALSGAPKAKFFLSQSNFLLACNYDDGTDTPNGIKWATEGSTTTWTATDSNTAGNALLRQSPGEIIAGAQIHDIVVIWKYSSMYVGRKIGGVGTAIWEFNLLSPKIGCVAQEAWVTTPVGIIFVSPYSGVYRFDGSVPTPIDDGIRNTIYRKIGAVTSVQMSHDEASACVFIWADNASFCYNYVTNEWTEPYSLSANGAGSLEIGFNNGTAFYPASGSVVRDATYDDYVTLGGTTNTARRCHLVTANAGISARVANLVNFSGSLTPRFDVPRLRDPECGPWDDTLLSQITPVWGWDSEQQDFAEPATTGSVVVRSRARMGSSTSVASNTYAMDTTTKRFDFTQAANNFVLTYTFANEAIVLSDFLYTTKKAGAR